MTMREKIARAIHAKRFSASAWDEWVRIGADTSEYLSMADAVLDAMRDPTPGMIEAGKFPAEWFYGPAAIFKAMIDAAKGETE